MTISFLLSGIDALAASPQATKKASKKKRKPAAAGSIKKSKKTRAPKPTVTKISFDAPSTVEEDTSYTPEDYTGRPSFQRRGSMNDGYNTSPAAEPYRASQPIHPLHRKDGASIQRRDQTENLDEIEAQLDPQNSQSLPSQRLRRSLPRVSTATWLSDDQTALHPIPRARMVQLGAYTSGTGSQASGNGVVQGNALTFKSASNGYQSGASLAYGFNEFLYVKAEGTYAPDRSETTLTSSLATVNGQRSVTISDGWREPSISLGATTLVAENARVAAELEGTIPLGSAKSQEVSQETKSNGLDGGGSISPKLIAIAKVPYVKLIGTARYRFQMERTTERTVNGLAAGTQTTTGGNSVELVAGIEIPAAFNLGLAGAYSQSEASTTVSSQLSNPISTTSAGTTTSNVSNSSRSAPIVGAIAYMGIPLDAVNMTLMPKAMYLTSFERNSGGLNLDQYDIWTFGLQGLIHF